MRFLDLARNDRRVVEMTFRVVIPSVVEGSLRALRLVEMTERISIMNQYYTYILSNKNDTTLYIGVTNDIERRVAEHRSGTIPGFTQKYKCHKLVYFESFSDVEQAIAREKQLKKWSRAKKDALIDTMNKDRIDLLPE